ncbi:MAG: DUF1186 domain-containing protein [Planctomycetaceae bacterium]|nr:DUF1186 domain-containing protein [Planctomycetaceae bacterium]
MKFSYVAMDRMVRTQAESDPNLQKQLQRRGRPLRSDGRALSDEELLEKLHSLGMTEVNRTWLDEQTQKFASVESLSRSLVETHKIEKSDFATDWSWIALTCLWERWFPDRPSFEMLDDWMQEGYDFVHAGDDHGAVRIWTRVWEGIAEFIETNSLSTLQQFDDQFGGSQSACNWVGDYSIALLNAARNDPAIPALGVKFCEWVIALAKSGQESGDHDFCFRRDLAEFYALQGELERANRMYEEWLEQEPRWGWGWIGWADLYHQFALPEHQDSQKAEEILKRGLAVSGVWDRKFINDRLDSLYEETGRDEDRQQLVREQMLDRLIERLDAPFDGSFREETLREVQQAFPEIQPRLIELIVRATQEMRNGKVPEGQGHFYSFFLLGEFRAKESLPAIIDAVSLPEVGPFELFGDAIFENLARILAVVADDAPEAVDRLIANPDINESVRWEAAHTYLFWVRDGRLTRDEAVTRLREQLRLVNENRDACGGNGLAYELAKYNAPEAMDEIREAFDRDLVDPDLLAWEDVESSLQLGIRKFENELKACPESGIRDTVEELRDWSCYQQDPPLRNPKHLDRELERLRDVLEGGMDAEIDDAPISHQTNATIRNEIPKVGRNSPCPCGSGKKFKKCCGVQ